MSSSYENIYTNAIAVYLKISQRDVLFFILNRQFPLEWIFKELHHRIDFCPMPCMLSIVWRHRESAILATYLQDFIRIQVIQRERGYAWQQ